MSTHRSGNRDKPAQPSGNPPRRPLLSRCARQLHTDLSVLLPAYAFARRAIRGFLEENDDGLYHDVSVLYAAWVHYTFGTDQDAFRRHLLQVVAQREPRSPLSGLLYAEAHGTQWGWAPPDDQQGRQAIRLIDRIDLALNYLRRHLGLALPPGLLTEQGNMPTWSVAGSAGSREDEREALLSRVAQLAEVACELFAE